MPHIRHTAVLYDEEADRDYEVVAYEETPFGDDDPAAREGTFIRMHDAWLDRVVDHGWEIVND